MGLDLQYLRYFVEVARLGAFNAAARHLGVSQPTLTRQLRRFEQTMGARLLVRSSSGVSLTPEGKKVLPGAKRTLREASRMLASLEASSTIVPLQLGLPPSAAQLLLNDVLDEAKLRGIDLAIVEGTNLTLMQGVTSGRLELAIVACPEYHTAYRVIPLWRESLYLVRAAALGALPATLSMAEAAAFPLVASSRKDTIRREIDRNFSSHALTPVIVLELEGVSTIKRILTQQALAALLPWLSIRAELKQGELAASRIRDLWITRCLIYPAGMEVRSDMKQLLKHLRHLPSQLLPELRESGFQWDLSQMPDQALR